MNANMRKIAYGAGTVLFVVSLGYVAILAVKNWNSIDQIPRADLTLIAAAASLYALAHLSSSLGWVLGVRGLGQNLALSVGLAIGLTTQVGKYLPGNVAQYFARVALAADAGVKLKDSGIASILEILGTLLAATAVIGLSILLGSHLLESSQIIPPAWGIASAAFVAMTIVSSILFLYFKKITLTALAAVTGCLTVSLVLTGISFVAVASSLSSILSPAPTLCMFTLAWAAGYFVPGAPAGLGVRDGILIAGLSPMIGPGPALACTVLHRVLTTSVDALAALFGCAWLRAAKFRGSGRSNRYPDQGSA